MICCQCGKRCVIGADDSIDYHMMTMDSGAAISISNPEVAKVRELEIFRYETPICLEFANQSKGKAYLWADFGKFLGEVALIPQCSSTLISTIKLARRGISFMMGEGFYNF